MEERKSGRFFRHKRGRRNSHGLFGAEALLVRVDKHRGGQERRDVLSFMETLLLVREGGMAMSKEMGWIEYFGEKHEVPPKDPRATCPRCLTPMWLEIKPTQVLVYCRRCFSVEQRSQVTTR